MWCKKINPKFGWKTVCLWEKNYVLHYRNLQLYLSLGVKLTIFHKVLKFKQSDWKKNDIDFNTGKRTNATNSFEKDFFKLMVNSVYGETIENLWERIRLLSNEKVFLKYTSRPTLLIKYLTKIMLLLMKLSPF